SRDGWQQKTNRNTSRAGILFGAPWFFIAKNAGRKLTTNFKRRGAPRRKRIRHCNFICAGWSRLFSSSRERHSNQPERVLRSTEYPAAIRNLIAQLRQTPGVGPRSAERIALWMVRTRTDQPQPTARPV